MGRFDILKNHVLVLVFLEPSTRTMGPFKAAMAPLGGEAVTVVGDTSSVKKGESLEDT
jgi:carbamoyl-phosphate synthase/aspartate carbamoyltransferase